MSSEVRGKLSRPLNFLMAADHAEAVGAMAAIKDALPNDLTDATMREWNNTP
jgi:hypothetical protein